MSFNRCYGENKDFHFFRITRAAVQSDRASYPVFDLKQDEETKEPPIRNIHNEIHGCKEIAARSAGCESKICGRNIAEIPVNRRVELGRLWILHIARNTREPGSRRIHAWNKRSPLKQTCKLLFLACNNDSKSENNWFSNNTIPYDREMLMLATRTQCKEIFFRSVYKNGRDRAVEFITEWFLVQNWIENVEYNFFIRAFVSQRIKFEQFWGTCDIRNLYLSYY